MSDKSNKPITEGDLKVWMDYAVGATEGAKNPYQMVDAWKAYVDTVAARLRRKTEPLLSNLANYEQVKALSYETVLVDGQRFPTAQALAARRLLLDVLNTQLGNSGQSIGLVQYDFGANSKLKAQAVGLPGAEENESVLVYVARKLNSAYDMRLDSDGVKDLAKRLGGGLRAYTVGDPGAAESRG